MKRSVSLVAARKDLGRIVEEVGRTGNAVKLTRRGRVVAQIVPDARVGKKGEDPLAPLGATIELRGSFTELTREVRALRKESGAAMKRREASLGTRGAKRGG